MTQFERDNYISIFISIFDATALYTLAPEVECDTDDDEELKKKKTQTQPQVDLIAVQQTETENTFK